MQGRVKLPCMGYMWLLTPRSIVDQFVVVPAVTVSNCLFHGVQGFCVNVRIPLWLFFLVSPSAWCLSIVTNGCASSDWLLGPMLVCVHLGDVCVMIGSSLMFLVFFVHVLIRKVGHICFITTQLRTSKRSPEFARCCKHHRHCKCHTQHSFTRASRARVLPIVPSASVASYKWWRRCMPYGTCIHHWGHSSGPQNFSGTA